jgi:hypothetical protein
MTTQFHGWKRVSSSPRSQPLLSTRRLAVAAGLLTMTFLTGGCAVVEALDTTPPVMPPRKSSLTQSKPGYRPSTVAPSQSAPAMQVTASPGRAEVATAGSANTAVEARSVETPIAPERRPTEVSVAVVTPSTTKAPEAAPALESEA